MVNSLKFENTYFTHFCNRLYLSLTLFSSVWDSFKLSYQISIGIIRLHNLRLTKLNRKEGVKEVT